MASVQCPVCRRQFDPETTNCMPFCSERCRMVDLGAWLDEKYGLAREPDEDEPAESP